MGTLAATTNRFLVAHRIKPLPADPKACGLRVSMQWVMECKGSPVGSALTDCLTFELSGL